MNILGFTHAFGNHGLGHFSRSTILLDALKQRFNCNYSLHLDCDTHDFSAIGHPNVQALNWVEIEILKDYIRHKKKFEITVIDSYTATSRIYQELKNISDTLIIFDDWNRLNYPRGSVVICPGIHFNRITYPLNYYKRIFGGIEFAILDPRLKDFQNSVKKKGNSKISILINFGSTNQDSLNEECIEQIVSAVDLRLSLVCFSNSQKLKNKWGPRVQFVWAIDKMQAYHMYSQADLAIVAGGLITYELAFLGIPMLCLPLNSEQKASAELLAEIFQLILLDSIIEIKNYILGVHSKVLDSRKSCSNQKVLRLNAAQEIANSL